MVRAGVRQAGNNWIARQEDVEEESRASGVQARSGSRVLLLEQPRADSGADVEAGTSVGADGAFRASLNRKNAGQKKFIKPNSQR